MNYGSQRWLPSSHLMDYMGATKSLKYPYLITRDTSPLRAVLEVFRFSPSDGCPATAPCLASTSCDPDVCPPLRRFRTPSSHTGQTGTHRSNRSGAAVAPSSVLRSWLCGSTKEPSGFLVNHWKPRKLDVASANRHS
jgi:hypothetical protein